MNHIEAIIDILTLVLRGQTTEPMLVRAALNKIINLYSEWHCIDLTEMQIQMIISTYNNRYTALHEN